MGELFMKKFITEVILVPDCVKEPAIFSDGAIKIRVDDEGGGRFLIISDVSDKPVRIDFSELDALFSACKELDSQ
jgi:hypothetical protein